MKVPTLPIPKYKPENFDTAEELIARAKEIAVRQHECQYRKYTGEPYITHPAAVAQIVQTLPHTPEMVAAAWLHDVVEDTDMGLPMVEYIFGPKVAAIVGGLTKQGKKQPIAIQAVWLSKEHRDIKTIKLADIYHNISNLVDVAPRDYALKYLTEKQQLIAHMWDNEQPLWPVIMKHIIKCYEVLQEEKHDELS